MAAPSVTDYWRVPATAGNMTPLRKLPPPDPDPVPALEIELNARLCASLEGLAGQVGAEQEWRRKISEAMIDVPFGLTVPLSGGTGTLTQAPNLGPPLGWWWSVRRLTAVGFTAGTVNVYADSTAGELIAPFPQAGVFTFNRGEQLLRPMQQMIIQATGIAGTVTIWGRADGFQQWFYPYYVTG